MAAKKKTTRKKTNGNGELEHRRKEVRQAIDNACDQLNSDGVDPRDYVEQLAWLFFLKAFDETETRLADEAEFEEEPYERRLDGKYRWSEWSSKKPDEMLKFVDGTLWEKLTGTGPEGMGDDHVGERFRRIFSSVRNHSRRGASFARVVQQINGVHFSDDSDVIALSEIYEHLLKRVAADSAGYAGEFYTQRHIIRCMIEVVQPKIGDRVYDPCFGTAGFLAEAADYMRDPERNGGKMLSAGDLKKLQHKTFFGRELKDRTYLFGNMNMLLHRIEGANLDMGDTLEAHATNVPERQKYDVVLSNPPYGGKMQRELQSNFTIRSTLTEVLFLQHIMANLAKGGRAAVIVPEGVLFRSGPDAKVRKRLLEEFNLHTVLSLPAGCFEPYTAVKTYILFFDRPADETHTENVWFYELTNDGFELNKARRPIDGEQITDFLAKRESREASDNSWVASAADIIADGFNLKADNPNREPEYSFRSPKKIVRALKQDQKRLLALMEELESTLGGVK